MSKRRNSAREAVTSPPDGSGGRRAGSPADASDVAGDAGWLTRIGQSLGLSPTVGADGQGATPTGDGARPRRPRRPTPADATGDRPRRNSRRALAAGGGGEGAAAPTKGSRRTSASPAATSGAAERAGGASASGAAKKGAGRSGAASAPKGSGRGKPAPAKPPSEAAARRPPAGGPPGSGSHASGVGRSRRPVVAALALAVVMIGLLFVTVFPTRTYLGQRAAIDRAERRIDDLDRETRRVNEEAERLSSPAEIERMARAKYGLVRPGESAYALLPPPAPPIGLPQIWPFKGLDDAFAAG